MIWQIDHLYHCPYLQVYPEQILPKVKEFILNDVVNKSKAALVVGFIDPNGTKVYSFGNISKENNIPVNGSTIFNIDLYIIQNWYY